MASGMLVACLEPFMDVSASPSALAAFVARHERLLVLTGAGCSTDSGIPDYRDADGRWKRTPPIDFGVFMREEPARSRYWARSMIGWRRFGRAGPNDAHRALARLEAAGRVRLLVTQNVDGLHQAAGSRQVVDLHGRLDEVRCMHCAHRESRAAFQQRLEAVNPAWVALDAAAAPDGDADLEAADFSRFAVPPCPACGGILKPDVVFFGEPVPAPRTAAVLRALDESDAILVVGSSLMVHSGYRHVRAGAQAGLPVAAVNLGRTRADELLSLKVERPCAEALAFMLEDRAAA